MTIINLDSIMNELNPKEQPIVIVRLKTSYWSDKRGMHQKKSITFLQRKCKGYNFVEEDISNVGAEDVISQIINLNECNDGNYIITTVNEKRDWETGYVEEWEYKLVEFTEEKE